MKVTLEKDYKRFYTIENLEQAKAVIAYEKDDEETAAGWAEYAVNEALKGTGDFLREIIKVTARTAGNCRTWNSYGETGKMDVWIDCIAKTADGFIEVGAYLTDIWQTGAVPYKHHEYIVYYPRQKN